MWISCLFSGRASENTVNREGKRGSWSWRCCQGNIRAAMKETQQAVFTSCEYIV